MQISDLIRKLNAAYSEHGDIEVIGYLGEPEQDFEITDVEYNEDGNDPTILLGLEPIKG